MDIEDIEWSLQEKCWSCKGTGEGSQSWLWCRYCYGTGLHQWKVNQNSFNLFVSEEDVALDKIRREAAQANYVAKEVLPWKLKI